MIYIHIYTYILGQSILFYGHYSMCWFYECVAQPWSKWCAAADVHSDPGASIYIFKHIIIYLMMIFFMCRSFSL